MASNPKVMVGFNELQNALLTLPDEVQNEVMEHTVRNMMKPVLIAAKRFAKRSVRTGALRDSLTIKVVVYPKTKKSVGLVGPRRDYYKKGRKLGKGDSRVGADQPANYAHLVERGHFQTTGKKGATLRKKTAKLAKSGKQWVPAKPFLRPAILTTKAQQQAEFVKGLEAGFRKAVRRRIKSGSHVAS